MKKETFYVLLLVVIAVTSYFGYNFLVQQKDFQQKQLCHAEAVKFVDNQQTTLDKSIKLDSSERSVALILDGYNKNLNTCLTIWLLSEKADPKNASLGNSTTTYISDVFTGKLIDDWWVYYDTTTFQTKSSGGSIHDKITNNPKDFNNEIDLLFGRGNSQSYILPQDTPIPTPVYNLAPTSVPTPIPVQSYKQTFFNTCTYGSIYCTCLYDALQRIDPGNEAADYIAESGNGNNAPMINAYAECNSRFGSK